LAPTQILIVDSAQPSRAALVQLFREKYKVQTAANGTEALALCGKAPLPDLVMLEVNLPGLDGFEVARRIRAQALSAHIPIIFLSEMVDEAAREKGMALGAVDYVAKSTEPASLRARVDNFIQFIDQRRHLQADYDALLEAAHRREEAEHTSRHDIKGSLAGIVGMVKSLADDDTMAPRHVSQLRLVEQTAQQVMDMVQLGGELYKIESGHFNLKAVPVEVGTILRRIVEVARSSFGDKNLTISVDTDTPVGVEMPKAEGDAALCYSLFQNLVKNACEAAPPGSRVTVMLRDENPLRVLIQNLGTVPLELRGRFFDKFATSGKKDGSGLGTYSARTMAVAQKGDVQMNTSDDDNSTTITVTLPRHVFAASV
jgi:DNA-binding response OmpR family regulator